MLVRRSLLGMFALLSLALVRTPALARAGTPCPLPGATVVTDPSGDIESADHDVTAIVVAEVFGGTHAGKFMVTIERAATGPPAEQTSGWWLVTWGQDGGDSTVTILVSKCQNDVMATYTYQSSNGEYSESGSIDETTFTAEGGIQMVLSRDKIHDPLPGSELIGFNATTLRLEWIALQTCIPVGGGDGTNHGNYTMGSCVVSVPEGPRASAIVLGPPLPNPARAGVRLELRVPEAFAGEAIGASVFDAAGRRIRSLNRIVTGGGASELEWDLRDDSARRVRPGSYWVRAALGGRTISRAVTVLY